MISSANLCPVLRAYCRMVDNRNAGIGIPVAGLSCAMQIHRSTAVACERLATVFFLHPEFLPLCWFERLAKLIRFTVRAWKRLLPPVITKEESLFGPKPFAFS